MDIRQGLAAGLWWPGPTCSVQRKYSCGLQWDGGVWDVITKTACCFCIVCAGVALLLSVSCTQICGSSYIGCLAGTCALTMVPCSQRALEAQCGHVGMPGWAN